MITQKKKIDSVKAMAAAKRSEDFWSAIDSNKLAKFGKNNKEMDIVGLTKKAKFAKTA
ncbi:hypothetical protein [Kosakonia sp. MUSA4]|uniref:hypothetical protein n=1 Tax=Kosakonia sp. MUSA4 TaxID=2067958 RepID=UPI0008AB373A|nr:hypothetical protein [Kosakonia sp. MUSA4]SEK90357.1 hypothetical protein SAMN04487787_104350 [Kosakonia sacchari]